MNAKRFQVVTLTDQGLTRFQVADTRTGELMDLPGLVRKRTAYRDKAERIADAMNDAHPEPAPLSTEPTDTRASARICQECGLPAYWHATAHERKSDPDACNTLRSAVVGHDPATPYGATPYAVDTDLANDLYPIFVALVDWSRKAGRTEINAVHAAAGAMRVIGARESLIVGLRRRYAAGSRATADLHREGRLT